MCVIRKKAVIGLYQSEKMRVYSMASIREHSSKIVFISFRNGTYWEEWRLRFNCGQKQNKQVKFFSTRTWRSDVLITLCPYSSSRFDSVSMKDAEEEFIATMRENEGEVFQSSIKIVKDLEARFGYEPVSATRKGWV